MHPTASFVTTWVDENRELAHTCRRCAPATMLPHIGSLMRSDLHTVASATT